MVAEVDGRRIDGRNGNLLMGATGILLMGLREFVDDFLETDLCNINISHVRWRRTEAVTIAFRKHLLRHE